jgi:pre-mRNA-processing factor SLU7
MLTMICSCGSITHQTKDCLERPRMKGAKWTNKNIAADEKIQDIKLATWDAKRDRCKFCYYGWLSVA